MDMEEEKEVLMKTFSRRERGKTRDKEAVKTWGAYKNGKGNLISCKWQLRMQKDSATQ